MDIDKLREEIEYDEGNVEKIYLDHLGLPTFGIGHLVRESDPEHGWEVGTPVSNDRCVEAFNEDIKTELFEKLEEFATPTENLEEIFENKEQIEVSKFYEKLAKPHAIAIDQWLREKIYYRHTDVDTSE